MKKIILSIFTSCLALAAPAQGVFEASLGTPPGDGGARLILGDFWCQVVDNELEFQAILPSSGPFTSSLNPVLSVPGSSIEFSLGEGLHYEGPYSDRNPFLPSVPPVPAGYDDDGNPYYFAAPGFLIGDIYTGRFTLPDGFLDELLAGNGKIELNPSLGGNISVTPTPEPTTLTLGLLGIGGLLFVQWRRRAVGEAFRFTHHQQAHDSIDDFCGAQSNKNHERKTP